MEQNCFWNSINFSVVNLTKESSGKGWALKSISLGSNLVSGFTIHKALISLINSNYKGVVNLYPFSKRILFKKESKYLPAISRCWIICGDAYPSKIGTLNEHRVLNP